MSAPFQTSENLEQTVKKDEVHQAAIKGNVALLQKLVKEGIHLNCKDSEGCTPLHVATKAGQLEVVEFLLNQRVDVDPINDVKNTPLHYGCKSGKENIVNVLLNVGASTDLEDTVGLTALHYACMGDLDEYIKTQKISGVYQPDLVCGFEQIATQLILNGADVNKQCKKGFTPLHYACHGSNTGETFSRKWC